MGMSALVPVVLLVAAVSAQQYGPPGYEPGLPIGSDSIVKTEGYEISDRSSGYRSPPSLLSSAIIDSVGQSYGAPASPQPTGRSQAYGVPGFNSGSPLASYKNPLENARYQVVPEASLPEQHSNLIRYIVLKEFVVSPNGSITPMDSEDVGLVGKTAMSSAGGRGAGEVEILKVQMAGSGETGSQGGSNVAYGPPGYPSGQPMGGDSSGSNEGRNDVDDGDYDDDDGSEYDDGGDQYDDDGDDGGSVENNSVSGRNTQNSAASGMASFMPGAGGMQVVPARGVALNNARRQSQENKPTSSETEAFMFSDPSSASGETTSTRRQSTASFNANSPSVNINAMVQSGGVRNLLRNTGNRVRNNRNRNRNNRNRNRNNRNRSNRNRNNNMNQAARPASGVASALASSGGGGAAAAGAGGGAGGGGNPPAQSVEAQMAQIQTALNLITRYLDVIKTSDSSSSSGPSSTLSAPSGGTSSYSNTPSGSGSSGGPYPASGQSASGASSSAGASDSNSGDSTTVDAPVATQTTFPASTYGPPPGSAGFSLQTGSAFPSVADAITRPIAQVAGLKSSIVTQLVSGLSNGIRSLGASAAASAAAAGSTPAPVYGVPSTQSAGGAGPLQLLRSVKGGIVQTVTNKGRAAVGIVGAKGQLVVKQVGTGANIVTKGLSQTFSNKHEAFQSVIKHIQSIFNSNPQLLNSGNW